MVQLDPGQAPHSTGFLEGNVQGIHFRDQPAERYMGEQACLVSRQISLAHANPRAERL